ncbi:hypothetical protein ETB97_004919 [Aspergillus alliaceus]|uniref:Uncharacterized protein n=1 Tax=Petromyces alliaceus TaxID=209559 RepID=A0A8H6A189_PETAA|nr:hypothetical protein ETB97_004919 [Aspergillus burnettii]
MVWNIPKLLAAVAVSNLFSPAFTSPTGDIDPWKDYSVENDLGDKIRSHDTQLSYIKREIPGLFPGLPEQPDFEINAGYSAIPKRIPHLNIDNPNGNGEVSDIDREGLATAFEAIDLASDKPSIVSRGEKEEKALSDFKHVWKGETFYHFIAAKDMDPKNRAYFDQNEIKALAKKGYELIKDKFKFNGNVIVSALFIPGIGVAVGSKPRGDGIADILLDKTHRVGHSYQHVGEWFKRYWNLIQGRQTMDEECCKKREDLLHAEDLAVLKAADEYLNQQKLHTWGNNLNFPKGTHIVSYGKYDSKPGSSSVS